MWQMRSSSKRKAGLQETAPDGRAGYWDYGVMEDTFAMKVPGVSAARMAAMEGRKPNEADLEKDKRKTAYDQLHRNDPGAFTVCSAGI